MLKETDIETLRSEVEAIHDAVVKLRDSGISERALLLLIHHACPGSTTRGPRYGQKPSMSLIKAVIAGMENLHEFVFPDDYEDDEAA